MKILIVILIFLTILEASLEDSNGFCKFQEFRCKGGSKCLLSEKLCNGVKDCPNGEDELGNGQWDCSRVTLGTSSKCGDQRKFFKCRFGGCISRSQVCDGVTQCWGGTDEAIDLCGDRRKIIDEIPSSPPASQRPRRPSTTTTRTTTFKYIPVETTRTTTVSPKIVTRPVAVNRLTTTTEKISSGSAHESAGSSSRSCPPIRIKDGEVVNCFHDKLARVINCLKNKSPEGTHATVKCDKFWSPPAIGSRSRERTCRNGRWRGGSRSFRCELDCGEGGHRPVGLIAGGTTSAKGKWPWVAGIYESDPPGSNRYSNICGATLISQNALLTAGHCVTIPHTNDVKNKRDLLIFLGKYYRSAGLNDENVQPIKPSKIMLHPDYNFANLDSDIAIIFLEQNVRINAFVHPVCLPFEEFELDVGAKGMLAGWGSNGNRQFAEELQETELPYVSSYACRKSHEALEVLVNRNNFCAGYRNGTSACDGDSGSGLVFNDGIHKTKWTIEGIVSGGVPQSGGRGCDPNYYVAFTYVSKFRNWIDRKLDRFDEFK